MRVLLTITLFFFMLLSGSHFYGNTFQKNTTPNLMTCITKNKQVKFNNEEQNSTIIEDSDIDLEEEHHSCDDFTVRNTLFMLQNSILTIHYSSRFILKYLGNKDIILLSFCKLSRPIYITQRVLRI
jgi:hypothetical protein